MAQRGRPKKSFTPDVASDPFASLENEYRKAQEQEETGEAHRCSIKLPAHLYKYLKAAMYRESSPENLCSMNDYFIKLLTEDMERHQND